MKNKDNQTVIQIAIAKKKDKISELLLTRNDLEVNLLIYQLIEENNLYFIELLLTSKNTGFKINALGKNGNNALHYTIISHDTNVISMLLKRKDLDVNTRDQQGNAPLHISVNKNYPDIVKMLLNRQDLDINARDKLGNTALHISINNNIFDIVSMLITRKDIDINAKGEDGYLPLDQANLKQNSDIIDLLLKHGAQEETKFDPLEDNRKLRNLIKKVQQIEINMQEITQKIEKMSELLVKFVGKL